MFWQATFIVSALHQLRTYVQCVGEKMNGKCNFQEGFYSICPTLSINVRQLHDRFHDSSMTTAGAAAEVAVAVSSAAFWRKNSPLSIEQGHLEKWMITP
jgi:hypothetical protein